MFEWLKGKYFILNENDYEITGYNKDTRKFIVTNDTTGEEGLEVNIFETNLEHNIDYYEDWQEELFRGLIRNEGIIEISIINTGEVDNSHVIEIYRHKTLLQTHEYSDQIILVNYAIVSHGEVKGEILAYQDRSYSGCKNDELKVFTEWIDKQIEEVSEFNNTDYWQIPKAIVTSNCLIPEEEVNLLWDIFNEEE